MRSKEGDSLLAPACVVATDGHGRSEAELPRTEGIKGHVGAASGSKLPTRVPSVDLGREVCRSRRNNKTE